MEMGRLVVTEFVSIDGVFEDPEAPRVTSTAAGLSSMTVAPTATRSNWTS